MPLKLVRRTGSDTWYIHGTVAGRRIRQATGTSDRRLAEEARVKLEADLFRSAVYGARAVVTFEQAVDNYCSVNPPSPLDARHLLKLVDQLGQKRLAEIDQAAADRAVKAILRPDTSPATKLRNVISPLRAVLSHAARRGWCDRPMLETPKGATGVKRTRWLTPAEFRVLHHAAGDHLKPLVLFLVGTGARLGEALELDWRLVNLAIGRATLQETKNRRDREVDLPPAVVMALGNLPHREGRVFRPPAVTRGKVVVRQPEAYHDTHGLYGGQIATAWVGACRRAGLLKPSGRLDGKGNPIMVPSCTPHVLRHTWASWRYALHKDLLRLKNEGDWSSVSLVERYAKLVPEQLLPDILAVWGVGTTLTQASSAYAAST
jgi:integrase